MKEKPSTERSSEDLVGVAANAFFVAVLTVTTVLFLINMRNRHWSDSEIWGVRTASYCFSSWQQYACGLKPAFNLILGTLDWIFPGDSIRHLMGLARTATGIAWCFTLFLALRMKTPTVLLLWYLGSSLFILDGSVARTDIWALPFLISGLSSLMGAPLAPLSDLLPSLLSKAWPNMRPSLAKWHFGNMVFSFFIAVLITPKALVTIFAFSPLFISRYKGIGQGQKVLRALWMVLPFLAVCLTLINWQNAGQFFLRLFQTSEYGVSYMSSERFSFLQRALSENPHLLVLVLLWMAIIIAGSIKQKKVLVSNEDKSALLLIAAMLLFPDKLPFWLATQTFLLLLLIAPKIWHNQGRGVKIFLFVLTTFAIANASHWMKILVIANNETQIQLVESADRKLRLYKDVKVYDGLGIVDSRNHNSYFLGPGQSDMNLENIAKIQKEKFDVLIIPRKLKGFLFLLAQDIATHYVPAAEDVYVRTIETLVMNPSAPTAEIQKVPLGAEDRGRRPLSSLALLKFDESVGRWIWLQNLTNGIDRVSPICEGCGAQRVRVSRFSAFFPEVPHSGYSNIFTFEPPVLRNTLLNTLKRRKLD